MIKNIIFDFGGVILTDDDIGVLFDNPEIKEKFKVNEIVLQNAWTKYWREVGENRMTIFEFYNAFQKEVTGKIDKELSKELFNIYKSRTRTLEPYNLLPNLKEKYKLFALTNIFKEGYEFKKEKYNLDSFFDMIVASCEVQISKADPEIFQILISRAEILPEESLFIDDRVKNVAQASKMGFKIHKYETIADLKKDLDKLGIIYE